MEGITIEEYVQRLTDTYGLVSGDLAADVLIPAAVELLATIKNRVFVEGRGTNDNNIGEYSRKPAYFSASQFLKGGGFIPQGKKGNIGDRLVPTVRLKQTGVKRNPAKYKHYSLVKPGKKMESRKSMYLKEGYKELRDIQGLQTAFVDLKYSGSLANSYQYEQMGQTVVLGLTDNENAKKRNGLENKYGNVFYASESEIATVNSQITYSLSRLIRSTLTGGDLQGYDINPVIT